MLQSVMKKLVNISQKLNDKLYEKEGLTDRVLKNQLNINNIRYQYDITDDSETVGDEGFVQ